MRVASRAGAAARACATSPAIANDSSRSPPRVAALTGNTCSPRASRSAVTISASSRASGTSTLLRATIRGRSSSPPYAASSASITSRSVSGSRPGSMVAASMTCTSTLHRSTWRRNSRPRPLPSLAPGIRPGHVGDGEADLAGLDDAEVGHQRGERVVGDLRPGRATSRRRGWTCRRSGSPTSATSATVLSSRTTSPPSPGSPSSAKPGALRRAEASAALPSPPRPPCATTYVVPAPDQVGQHLAVGVLDDGAVGHRQDQVVAVGAAAVAALAGLAAGGLPVRGVVVVEQRRGVRVDDQDDVAAATAVAAVGAAERLELLAVDRARSRGRRHRRRRAAPRGRRTLSRVLLSQVVRRRCGRQWGPWSRP